MKKKTRKPSRASLALAACQLLVDAYDLGEQSGGSVDWNDLDRAHDAARMALGLGNK